MPKLVMVFNDTEEIQQLFNDLLAEAGYQVVVRGFGTRDLEDVRQQGPALVIADCPPFEGERNGWQLVQKLKMSPETEHIPIIVCSTSLGMIHDMEGWLKGKNVLAIAKPFTQAELLAAVKQQIGEGKPA